jgi:hypothetical protein
MTNSTPRRLTPKSLVKHTLITLVIDMSINNHNEIMRLLRSLERRSNPITVNEVMGKKLVWQVIVLDFDEQFWQTVAEGNGFELYIQDMNRYMEVA